MTSGGNNFNDFSEILPTGKIATKIDKTFLVFSSVAVGLFLEWAQCCSINSNHLNPALSPAPFFSPSPFQIFIRFPFAFTINQLEGFGIGET